MSTYLPRKAYRDIDAPVLGGVAGGLAEHLAVPVLWVRAAFLITIALGGLGVAMYGALWLVLPARPVPEEAPGLASARRGGRRPRRIARLADSGPALALGALGVGALFFLQALVGGGGVFWPLAIGLAGIAVLWRQADEAQRERWLDSTTVSGPVRVILGRGGVDAYARIAAGLGLVVLALLLLALRGGFAAIGDVLPAVLLAVVGVGVIVGPWLYRLTADLSLEREQRVRSEERADVAAHLHDSVLQTLALIQKNAEDPQAVGRLARAQERDLRSWLYAGEQADETTLARSLRRVAAEVEDAHGITVDVVTVGDVDVDEHLRPVVAAVREAVTNAAKHAGTDRVDVFAETTPEQTEVFVRDRGRGFALEQVPVDRHGVRGSILDRMHRHGGRAEIRSTPGEGTEVRLSLPLRSREDAS